MNSIKYHLDKISYYNIDKIVITLDLKNSGLSKQSLTNININISELGEKRNEFKFGFGSTPTMKDDTIIITQKLSDTLINGIYFISNIKFIYSHPENADYNEISLFPKINFDIKFFHITHEKNNSLTNPEIEDKIKHVLEKRNDYRNKAIISLNALKSQNTIDYKVLIFGIGCLIHATQEMNGFTIYPIKNGLEYNNLNDAVNQFLTQKFNFQLPFNSQINDEFKKSTPIFVIDFEQVKAISSIDASMHCVSLSQSIYSILGFKKGQRPNIFASIIIEKGKPNFKYNFQFPGYKGNLVSEFSPTATANLIDRLLPLLNENPWIKLILDSHAYALNEENIDLKYFRFWAILELIAKKEVLENNLELFFADKTPIMNEKKQILKTDNAFRKVYYFVYSCNFQKHTVSCSESGYEFSYLFEMSDLEQIQEGTKKISLWEALNAIYAIRNATAHQGKFLIEEAQKGNWKDKLAAKYYSPRFPILLDFLENIVNKVIEKQIKNFA